MDYELSQHTKDMLKERNIVDEWIWQTLNNPDRQYVGTDKNVHYFRSIEGRERRILHIVVNANVSPQRVVTAFFDRRARR